MVGGPYPEIALVYGPAPKMAVRPRGRPRTRTRPHESLDAAISLMARGAGEAPPPLGATVLLMTAPRDAAVQFAADVVSQLQAEGHQDAAERVMVAAGAFDPSVVNAALLSPNHARAFLSDWQAGRTCLLGMSDEDPDDAGSDASPLPPHQAACKYPAI